MMPPSAQLGRYSLEEHLGSGAFADVYRAIDTKLQREVAMKILKPRMVVDEEVSARFIQEAQVGANLFHPNIATVLDMGEVDGFYYLVMRYVDGQTLNRVIKEKGQLPWELIKRVIAQIGEALAYAHQKGFVHRDVKPHNIILGKAGAVLTDFGLVRALQDSGMTTTGAILGTPHYIAPEIWDGGEASPASDQYALACVIYEMLTARILFDGKTPPAVMAKHLRKIELAEAWPNTAPLYLQGHLQKALQKRPQERFGSISLFLEALLKPQPASAGVQPDVDLVRPAIQGPLKGFQRQAFSEHTHEVNLKKRGTNEKPTDPSKREMGAVSARNPAGIAWVEVPAGHFLYGEEQKKVEVTPLLYRQAPHHQCAIQSFLGRQPPLSPAGRLAPGGAHLSRRQRGSSRGQYQLL
jgi:serine/threonine protein kinase